MNKRTSRPQYQHNHDHRCKSDTKDDVNKPNRPLHTRDHSHWVTRLVKRVVNRLLFMTPTQLTYTFLALCLVVFVYIVIMMVDEDQQLNRPFLSPSSSLSRPINNPFSTFGSAKQLKSLIENISNCADVDSGRNVKVIVAIAVNYAYRKLALNFICNLKRLNICNYVVLAMDRSVYEYLAQRGAHVFFHDLDRNHQHNPHQHRHRQRRKLLFVQDGAGSDKELDKDDMFGSDKFVETSRRKSMLVLRLLTLGYSVLFSDVDVVWVQNPLPYLTNHTAADIVIQSDRKSSAPISTPLNFNLNSGLYFARSSPQTILALRAIIKYSYSIRRSEQKAFNYVLCGAFKEHRSGPGQRVGTDSCKYRNPSSNIDTIVHVLSPLQFPNGSNESLWQWSQRSRGPKWFLRWRETSNGFSSHYPDIVAVHANYIEGRKGKVSRIQRIGYWFHIDDQIRQHSRDECK